MAKNVFALIIIFISFGVLFWNLKEARKQKKISQQQQKEGEKGEIKTKEILGL